MNKLFATVAAIALLSASTVFANEEPAVGDAMTAPTTTEAAPAKAETPAKAKKSHKKAGKVKKSHKKAKKEAKETAAPATTEEAPK